MIQPTINWTAYKVALGKFIKIQNMHLQSENALDL